MANLDDYDWALDPLREPIQVDMRTQGDEWVHYLFRRLAETTSSTGYQARLESPFGYLYTPSGGVLVSSLLVAQSVERRPICYVVGYGDPRDEDLRRWADAITYGGNQVGRTESFSWLAVVGEDPDSNISSPLQLTGSSSVGGITLLPNDTAYMEFREGYSLSSASGARTFLTLARGVAKGYDAWVATRQASADLKLLCSMLSLASGRTWVLREGPNAVGSDRPPDEEIRLPEFSGSYPENLKRQSSHEGYPTPVLFDIPGWFEDGWTRISKNPRLAYMVRTYHESILLSSKNHESYSLLAAVAIVEAAGNREIKKLPKCRGCENCRGCGLVTGSSQRFRDALARVMPEDEASALGKLVYVRRSRTAHDAMLYGTESVFGLRMHGVYSENPTAEFGYVAQKLRTAAAKLLRLELGAPA